MKASFACYNSAELKHEICTVGAIPRMTLSALAHGADTPYRDSHQCSDSGPATSYRSLSTRETNTSYTKEIESVYLPSAGTGPSAVVTACSRIASTSGLPECTTTPLTSVVLLPRVFAGRTWRSSLPGVSWSDLQCLSSTPPLSEYRFVRKLGFGVSAIAGGQAEQNFVIASVLFGRQRRRVTSRTLSRRATRDIQRWPDK